MVATPKAEPFWRRLKILQEKLHGPDHPDVAMCLKHLALATFQQGKYKEAEPMWRQVLAIKEKEVGPDNPEVADCLHHIAETLRFDARYDDAEPLYQKSLDNPTEVPRTQSSRRGQVTRIIRAPCSLSPTVKPKPSI